MRRAISLLTILAAVTVVSFVRVPMEASANNCSWGNTVSLGGHQADAWDGTTWVHVRISVSQRGDVTNSCQYDYGVTAWADSGPWGFVANPLNLRVWRCGSFYSSWSTTTSGIDTGWIGGYGTCNPQADDAGTAVRSAAGSYVYPYTNW